MAMSIEGIAPLWETSPFEQTPKTAEAAPVPFSGLFQAAIDNVRQMDAEKNEAEYLLATGQMDNPAVASIASSKYVMSVELLVQLRNKALDAYSELMRISL